MDCIHIGGIAMQKISELEKYYSRASKKLFRYKAIKKRLPIDTDACAEHLFIDMKSRRLPWLMKAPSIPQRELMQKACVYAVTDYVNSLDYACIIMNAAGDPKHHLDGTLTKNNVTATESGDAVIKYDRHIYGLHKKTVDDINGRAKSFKDIKHVIEFKDGSVSIRKYGHFTSTEMVSGVEAAVAITTPETVVSNFKMVAIGEDYDKS
jgi:hypothetical protein